MDLNSICPEENLRPFLEVLATALPESLSSDQFVRKNAEERLKQAASTKNPALPLAMTIILRDDSAPEHIRHLSGVLLKQYIQELWETTEGEAIKNAIKAYLLEGVAILELWKLNTMAALCVSKIAATEWPERWVDLLPILTSVAAGGTLNRQAVRCLVFLAEEVPTVKGPALMEAAYPHLLNVLQSQDAPPSCKMSAVKVVGSLLHSFRILVMEDSPELNQALQGFIPQWIVIATQIFQQQIQAFSVSEGFGIPIQLIQTLNTVVSSFPELCGGLGQFLDQVWGILTNLGQHFETVMKNELQEDGPYTSDGDCVSLTILIAQILEFFCTVAGSPQNSICELLRGPMDDLFRLVLQFMQLTPSQLELWTSDPNEFVAEEEDDMGHVSIRHSGQYLIMELTEIFPKEAFKKLFGVASEHFESAGGAGTTSNWQILEAEFFALGRIAQPFLRRLKKAEKKGISKEQKATQLGFPLQSFKAQIFECLNLSSINKLHILQATVLSVASQYLVLFSPEECGLLFQLCMVSLEPTTELPMRIYACRTMGKLMLSMDAEMGAQPELVQAVTKALALIAELVRHGSDNTIHIMVGTLIELAKFSPQSVTAVFQSGVELDQVALMLWDQYPQDPFIVEIVADLLQQIVSDGNMSTIIGPRFIGQLEIMMKGRAAQCNSGVTETCINVLKEFVQGMSTTAGQQTAEGVLQRGLVLLLEIISGTDDNSLLQAGSQCIKAYLQVLRPSLLAWPPSNSGPVLQQISSHVLRVLAPSSPDAAAMFSGEVVLNLLLQLNSLVSQEDVGVLLGCLLQRIQYSRSKMLTDQFVIVFIRLIILDPDSITDFLCNSKLETPLIGSGMELVFSQWLRLHEEIQTEYLAKVSAVGMLELLGCCLRKTELQQIRAKSDLMEIGPSVKKQSPKVINSRLQEYQNATLQECLLNILIQTATDLEEVDENPPVDNEDDSDDDMGFGGGNDDDDDLDNFMTESINQIHGGDASGMMGSSPFVGLDDFMASGGGGDIFSGFAASEDFLYDESEAENDPLGKINLKDALGEFMNKPKQECPKPLDAILTTISDETHRNRILSSISLLFGTNGH